MALKNTLFVFDIDGTLTDSVSNYLISVTKSLFELGISDIDTDYDNYKHHTDSYALRYNYERNFDTNMPEGFLDRFETEIVRQMSTIGQAKEIKGAKSLITHFRNTNTPFCFATGALPKPSFLKLNQCEIWYHEDLLATSKTHESREGFVLEAIEKAKTFYNQQNFDRIISIGDGVWDFQTAQNLSLDFVGIGNRNRVQLTDKGAKHCFEDLMEFKKWLV